MHRVVFVCSGNICRSPMALRFFEREAAARSMRAIALSMSTLGLVRASPPHEIIEIMADRQIDIRDHRSQPLNPAILKRASHVIAMAQEHITPIKKAAPNTNPILLGAFDPLGGTEHIDDPIGGSIDEYRAAAQRIERCIIAFTDHLQAPETT